MVLVFVLAFLLQHVRLASLERRWPRIEPKASEIENIQNRIRKFRGWFGDQPQSMLVMKRLTEVFPAEGSVWLTSLKVKNLSEVSCSGKARSNRDWLDLLDRLREAKGVREVKVVQVKGSDPVQFAFNFVWREGPAGGR